MVYQNLDDEIGLHENANFKFHKMHVFYYKTITNRSSPDDVIENI